jgi:hypothetical protein
MHRTENTQTVFEPSDRIVTFAILPIINRETMRAFGPDPCTRSQITGRHASILIGEFGVSKALRCAQEGSSFRSVSPPLSHRWSLAESVLHLLTRMGIFFDMLGVLRGDLPFVLPECLRMSSILRNTLFNQRISLQ